MNNEVLNKNDDDLNINDNDIQFAELNFFNNFNFLLFFSSFCFNEFYHI